MRTVSDVSSEGSSTDEDSSDIYVAALKKQNILPDNEELEVLPIRRYITLDSLLVSAEKWKRKNTISKIKRTRFLTIIIILYFVLWFAHVPLLMWKVWNIRRYAEKEKAFYERPGVGQPLHPTCIRTRCAALCPELSETPSWYTLAGVPYASLPRMDAYFDSAAHPFDFRECYLAYWHGVAVDKRQFVDGQIRFQGRQSFDDNSACAQTKVVDGKSVPIGKPKSCLTLSLRFKWTGKKETDLPIVVYIGGNYFLSHRPALISSKLTSEIEVIYVILNYRLGVFGFSDFGIHDSGPNNAILDVRKGLIWIQEFGHLFGADRSRVMIYGENSGATIAAVLLTTSSIEYVYVNEEKRPLFSHMWLADGSVVVPDVPKGEDRFQELLLNDPGLLKECKEWTEAQNNTVLTERSQPFKKMHQCLRMVSLETWLNKTPISWRHSQIVDRELLPEELEQKRSLIKRDPIKTRVENPLASLFDKHQGTRKNIADLPLVFYSTMIPHNSKSSDSESEYWTIAEMEQKVKKAFSSFQTSTSHFPYALSIWAAYKPYLANLAGWGENFDYRALYDMIRNDLRGACPYNWYSKGLQTSGYSREGPIYRILNRIQPQPYITDNGTFCDVPFFLIDDGFTCGGYTRPLDRSLTSDQKEMAIRAFVQFAHFGVIRGASRMQIPWNSAMPPLETTYNVLTEMGLTTAGSREISMLAACKAWSGEHGTLSHLLRYSWYN